MNSTQFNLMFDLLIAAYGAFLIYSSWKMKTTGEPSSAILPKYDLTRCIDKKGFIDATYLKTILFGSIIILYAVFEILNEHFFHNSFIDFVGMVVIIISFVWYVIILRKIRSKFVK